MNIQLRWPVLVVAVLAAVGVGILVTQGILDLDVFKDLWGLFTGR